MPADRPEPCCFNAVALRHHAVVANVCVAMGHESTPDPITLVYKTIPAPDPETDGEPSEVPLHLDVYPPEKPRSNDGSIHGNDRVEVPAVVYFHGGGLLAGNKKSWFPEWLRSQRHLPFT